MARTAYKSTVTGAITTDSRGFQFVKTQSFGGFLPGDRYYTTYYGMYSSAAGGWDRAYQNGYSESPYYHTSGDIYSRMTGNSIDGITQGRAIGYIYAIQLYNVSVSSNGGGSVTGGGEYESGTKVTIKATPSAGYVVTQIGSTVFNYPSEGEKSITIEVLTDVQIEVKFERYYYISFDSNGGNGSIENITPCFPNNTYVLPTKGFTREGYNFLGFSSTSDGEVEYAPGSTFMLSSLGSITSITLYAVWWQAKLTYNVNGGESSSDIVANGQKYYGNITLAEGCYREGREFIGWKIGDEIYPAGSSYNLISDVVAVAQWSTISFKNNNTDAGKISLYNLSSNKKAVEENEKGYLIFSGTVGTKYRVDCNLKSELFAKKGVYVDGEYIEPYIFTFTGEDVVGEYFYREKSLFSIEINSTPNGNIASVTSPAEPDKDGKYVEGRIVTITGTPAPGYKLKAASIFDADKNLPIGDFDNIENNTFTIDGGITCNLRIACVFVKIDYDISASVDEKSVDVISKVTAKMGDTKVLTATYGDTVMFEADVLGDYQFGGWYADGVLVSTDNPYKHTVKGSINLVAKAKVAVNLNIEHINNREDITPINSCALVINEVEVPTPHKFDVILGDSFSYVLVLGALTTETSETWKFDAWYSGETKIPYRKEDIITPTSNLSMTAKVTSAPIERTLSVSFVNEETLGYINANEDTIKISPSPKSKVMNGSTVVFTFEETQEIQLTFVDEIVSTENLAFSKVVFGTIEIADSIFTYLLNDNLSATAYYGSEGERTTAIDFSTGSDRTMGEIIIDGKTSAMESMPISVIKNRGKEVTITAQSNNGYKFVGWYINISGIGDPYIKSAATTLKVTTNRTLFAKFVQDPNAVYEWEGSNENKMMTWRSKTYEATKPFNPSACRVDTTGYPVWALSVEMFSAPDATPTAIAILKNVRSQDSRRLPIRRMERYMQVALENNNEVDAVFVGTSMGGLTV